MQLRWSKRLLPEKRSEEVLKIDLSPAAELLGNVHLLESLKMSREKKLFVSTGGFQRLLKNEVDLSLTSLRIILGISVRFL